MAADIEEFAREIEELGRRARAGLGAEDVNLLARLKRATLAAELAGRALLQFAAGPWTWLLGLLTLAFHFAVESQLNHSIMHGAYEGLPGAERFSRRRYETRAVPFRSRTWGEAHRIHHVNPSLLGADPDTVHPLFRVHADQPWRPWHLLNVFLGALLVFECWALDYDSFLKKAGLRPADDRGELRKLASFLAYNYLLFPLLAGARWKQVLVGTFAAALIRNLIFVGLQTASSVGAKASTAHPRDYARKTAGRWHRFQAETSKNFALGGIWRLLVGGLDRHIEHHLFPNLPPNRLHALSGEVRALCARHGVSYEEFPSFWASLRDSVGYLGSLSLPA
jgi:linoleoyl-CoA desaturase